MFLSKRKPVKAFQESVTATSRFTKRQLLSKMLQLCTKLLAIEKLPKNMLAGECALLKIVLTITLNNACKGGDYCAAIIQSEFIETHFWVQ